MAVICVGCICSIAAGNDGPTTAVYLAHSRIPAGTTLTEADVRLTEVPTNLVPTGAITDTLELANQMTSAPIPGGAILTSDNFVATSQVSHGYVIIPLPVSAQVLSLIQPGDHVTVFLSDHSTTEVSITRGIRVVTIPAQGSSGMFSSDSSPVILVEVPESLATQITSSGGMGTTTVAIE